MALNYKTTNETAKLLHVHRQTIMRWIKDGTLKANKIGRKYLISEEEIKRQLESGVKNEEK